MKSNPEEKKEKKYDNIMEME
jgi:hypothetical protein